MQVDISARMGFTLSYGGLITCLYPYKVGICGIHTTYVF